MIRRTALCLLLALAAASSAPAQVKPQPGPGDARLQTIDYDADQVVLLEVSPGYQMTVELAPGEEIENVAVGDLSAWQVTPNRRGDRLFIKPLQSAVTTNMTVITNQRAYAMILSPLYGPTPDMGLTVRFRYPEAAAADDSLAATAQPGRYKLRGDRWLRPTAIGDDGQRTFIQWAAERPIPAVYGQDWDGKEVLVTGHMRDGDFVLDTVLPKLIFRIDRHSATASRIAPRGGR